jgi:hypothetical protein
MSTWITVHPVSSTLVMAHLDPAKCGKRQVDAPYAA